MAKKKDNLPNLVLAEDFEQAVKKVLSTTKGDSDKQLEEFQAANVRKRHERFRKKKD